MKKKFFAFWAVCAVVLSAVGFSFAADGKKGKNNNQLLALLPASEAAMTVDVKRFLSDALPQILSANQPMLTEIMGKIDQMKTRTGVDARQFEQIAAGVSSFKSVDYGFDYEPIALARGQFDSAVLIAAAKTVAAGKYREEKIGTRTVYIFSPEKVEAGEYTLRAGDGKEPSKVVGFLGKFLVGLNKEMALTAYDKNTLAIGSLARVRELLDTAKPRLGGEVATLVARNSSAIVSFGALLPNGLSNFMQLDEDELGKSLAGIRQLSGSMDVAGGNTTVAVVAKTLDPAQARNLKDTISGFQSFAGVLKSSKREDQKVYGRMLESAKLTQTGSELAIDLLVPQSDLNVIVGAKK